MSSTGHRSRDRSSTSRFGAMLRSLSGGTALLVGRRARRDLPLLLAWTALAALVGLLAAAGPLLLSGILDRGASEAVAKAGSATDIVVDTPVGEPRNGGITPLTLPADVVELSDAVVSNLPSGIRSAVGSSTLTVTGPATDVAANAVAPPLSAGSTIDVTVAMLTPQSSALEVVDGVLPSDAPPAAGAPIAVVISSETARLSSLGVGSVITLPEPDATGIRLSVVGIVDPVDPDALVWRDLPHVFGPSADSGADRPLRITVLADSAGVSRASTNYLDVFDGTLRIRLDPTVFTRDLVDRVTAESNAIEANSTRLTDGSGDYVTVHADFPDALSGYPPTARAATAQMSMMVAGVIGVGGAVLVLLSGLIVARRAGDVALERARGGSLAALAVRAVIESVVLSVIGVGVGVVVALLVLRTADAAGAGVAIDPLLVVLIAVAAAVVTPTLTVLYARRLRTGRRSPANRRDRADIARLGVARRVAFEVTVAVLAVGAVTAFTGRGLLQDSTEGIDPLLASTPLLAAALVTVVLLRVYRWPVRLVGSLSRRSPGLLGLIGAVRAERALRAVPLLALTLAVALATTAGLIGASVSAGQVDASWERIGADVRVDGTVTESDAAAVSSAAGVTAASASATVDDVDVAIVGSSLKRTLLAVDTRYPDVAAALPSWIRPDAPTIAAMRTLGDASPSDALPAVVDARLAERLSPDTFAMTIGDDRVPLKVVGITDAGPDGYLEAPFLYVDLDSLDARLAAPVDPDTLLAVGDGAGAAVGRLESGDSTVQTRDGWLGNWRGQAIAGGVQGVFVLSAIVLAILALIALVATTVAGARDRARSLSLLRTLGTPARLGWWLALSELIPLVLAALIGGCAAGVGLVLLLAPSLGLSDLTGGIRYPPAVISPEVLLSAVAAAVVLLIVGVGTEIVFRRRDRLSDVLRVGETL